MAGISNTTLTTGRNLLPPQTPFVELATGVLTNDAQEFFLGLINQFANAIPTTSVALGLAAQGTTQATALPLTAGWNEIDAATVANNGVLLAALNPGQSQTVFNQSGMAINVYPPPGMAINGNAANLPFSLGNGLRLTFDFISNAQIRS